MTTDDLRPAAPPTGREATLSDVAILAGVSSQTVSRVVNAHPHVSDATRARVHAAISTVGYRPNFSARRLATNRSHSVGVLSAITHLWGPSGVRQSLDLLVRQAGYRTIALSLPESSSEAVRSSFDDLVSSGVDGIIVIAADDLVAGLAAEQRPGVPVVVIEGATAQGRPGLALDHVQAGRAATDHLLDLGYRSVAHVSGPDHALEARHRTAGWAEALRARGLGPGPHERGDWSPASGFAAGHRLLRDDDVTAVFVANDEMSIGVVRAARERGRRLPQDLSIVGFDDVPEAAYLFPPLTTVRQDFGEVGRRIVDSLRADIEGTGQAVATPMDAELVVRSSTAPPAPR